MFSRTCALDGCTVEFQTDNSRKTYCSRKHTNVAQAKKWRANHRKKGGGGGGGNGGGGGPTLFDTIVTIDPQATYSPDTCYRTPAIPARKPVESDRPERRVRNVAA
jgi:hypothetical protein